MINWKSRLHDFGQQYKAAETEHVRNHLVHDMYNIINSLEERVTELEEELGSLTIESTN